jgi:hypothetical protein
MALRYILFGILLATLLFSCEDILEEPDISGKEVELLAPKEATVVFDNAVNFNWNGPEDATSFRVQVALPNFGAASQLLVDSTMVQDTLGFLPTQLSKVLHNGDYQWRVKALNGGFETDYATASFKVEGDGDIDLDPPATPVLTAPTDGTVAEGPSVDFSWTRTDISGSAERDSIFIYTDADLQSLETKGLGANKTFTVDLAPDTYYWFVRAYDAYNEGGASSVFELTVE